MSMEMPERQPSDGPISISRPAEGVVEVTVQTDGVLSSIRMSEFNATRVLGALSVMLGFPLSKSAAKAIKF